MLNYSGWWYTYPSEKYEFVSWDDYSQNMEKKKGSKPPTSIEFCEFASHYQVGFAKA